MELKRGGNDRKWIRSHCTITNDITNTVTITITTSVATRRSKRWPRALDGNGREVKLIAQFLRQLCEGWRNPRADAIPFRDSQNGNYRHAQARALLNCGYYDNFQTLTLSKSGNYRILNARVLSKSENYRHASAGTIEEWRL